MPHPPSGNETGDVDQKKQAAMTDNTLPPDPPDTRLRSYADRRTLGMNATTKATDAARPVAQGVDPGLAILEQHRAVWAKKPSLRRVYESYFRSIIELCSGDRPIVELGAGPGFFKACCPEIIATDISPTPWNDAVVDACALPYDDASVANLVMIDVFHHLENPYRFMEEASRVLKVGGRVVMLEPWTSPVGYLFYRYIHHEGTNRHVDPRNPFSHEKAAFDGNAALPKMIFADNSHNEAPTYAAGRLRLRCIKPFTAASWLLTGGFRPYGLLPAPLVPLARVIDAVLQPAAAVCALRAIIVLQRTAENVISRSSPTIRSACEGTAARPRCPRDPAHERTRIWTHQACPHDAATLRASNGKRDSGPSPRRRQDRR